MRFQKDEREVCVLRKMKERCVFRKKRERCVCARKDEREMELRESERETKRHADCMENSEKDLEVTDKRGQRKR